MDAVYGPVCACHGREGAGVSCRSAEKDCKYKNKCKYKTPKKTFEKNKAIFFERGTRAEQHARNADAHNVRNPRVLLLLLVVVVVAVAVAVVVVIAVVVVAVVVVIVVVVVKIS